MDFNFGKKMEKETKTVSDTATLEKPSNDDGKHKFNKLEKMLLMTDGREKQNIDEQLSALKKLLHSDVMINTEARKIEDRIIMKALETM